MKKTLFFFNKKSFVSGSFESKKWLQRVKLARAVIGLSQSGDMLEPVWDVTSAKKMFDSITNVSQKHTLLKKLSPQKDFFCDGKNAG